MTAPKKPDSRRAVFDASFGLYSLNNNTPKDQWCETLSLYDYPKVDDFAELVVNEGRGCYIWKRDLSRFYLQIPLDPVEYPKVCFVWRNKLFFFTALMFGLTHSGLQGQRVSSAVKWIHENRGLETGHKKYNCFNYSDDIGGGEKSLQRSTESYNQLGHLLAELGLDEATSKAHPPSTKMVYLGVMFDTVSRTMSIPGEKMEEVREELNLWLRRKKVNKKSLQKLLGKLFWISRCIKYSRGFMGRLLAQLRELSTWPDQRNTFLSEPCKEDILWWSRYMRNFNGVSLLYPVEPVHKPLSSLLELDLPVCCGDAQLHGGGAYYGIEYWSREFPPWLQDQAIPIHVKEFWVIIASTVPGPSSRHCTSHECTFPENTGGTRSTCIQLLKQTVYHLRYLH